MYRAIRVAAAVIAVLALVAALESLSSNETITGCHFDGTGDVSGYIIANITIPPGTYRVISTGSATGLGNVIDAFNATPPLGGEAHPVVACTGNATIRGASVTWLMAFPSTVGVEEANLTVSDDSGAIAWVLVRLLQPPTQTVYTAAPLEHVAKIEAGGRYTVDASGSIRIEGDGTILLEIHAGIRPGQGERVPDTVKFDITWSPKDAIAKRVLVGASISYDCVSLAHFDEGVILEGKHIPIRGTLKVDQHGTCQAQSDLPAVAAVLAATAALLVAASACRGGGMA